MCLQARAPWLAAHLTGVSLTGAGGAAGDGDGTTGMGDEATAGGDAGSWLAGGGGGGESGSGAAGGGGGGETGGGEGQVGISSCSILS